MPSNSKARNPKATIVSEESIRDVLADDTRSSFAPGRLTVMSVRAIAVKLLGFDPTAGQNTTPTYGGHSPDFFFNQHLSMGALRRVLNEMTEQGVVTKVTDLSYTATPAERRFARLVHFSHGVGSGYVLTEEFEQSGANYDAEQRDTQRSKIMEAAAKVIAEKHADEVQALYATECAKLGLGAERETQTEVSR